VRDANNLSITTLKFIHSVTAPYNNPKSKIPNPKSKIPPNKIRGVFEFDKLK